MRPDFFVIPSQDAGEFAQLPYEVRDRVRRYLCLFAQAATTGDRSINAALRKLAVESGSANIRGFSFSRLRVQYYRFLRAGDWRVLIDKAKASKGRKKK